MLRVLLVGCLSFFLLGMQQESLVHALQHDKARITDNRDTGIHKPAGEGPCEWCALFSGGGHAAPATQFGFDARSVVEDPPIPSVRQVLAAATVYYSSRAPPSSR